MESIKQTAVEWMQEAISKKVNNELGPYFIDLFDNAKELEKQQIIKAWANGGSTLSAKNAEQYYNETFNQ